MGPCGLCAIPRLRAAGVHSLKVVGREASLERKCASVKLTAVARDLARDGGGPESIRQATIAMRGAASLCSEARGCYYPDLWQGRGPSKHPMRNNMQLPIRIESERF